MVIISANEDVKTVAPEGIRRTVICRMQAGINTMEVMRSSSVVRTVQREVGTAFYREYLRRMLEIVSDLLVEMKSDESESASASMAESSDISERNHEIRYNAGATWEADRILKELPETLEAHKSREWLVMNLDEAKTFFDIPFKKSWMDRFQKK